MGRKNKREVIGVIPADEIFDAQKPRYNAHQAKCGAHGKNKYDRNKKHKGQGWD